MKPNYYKKHSNLFDSILSVLNNLFNPHYIVLVGGLSLQPALFEGLKEKLSQSIFLDQKYCPELYINQKGDSAALFGAMAYADEKSSWFSLIFLFSCHLMARELVIWTSNEAAANGIKALKSEFELAYKTKVIVEVLNKDLTSLFKTAALTGKGPDILLWAHDVSGELAQSGLIEPLDENQSVKNKFLPVSIKAFKYKGRLYGYPYAVESLALFYNTDLVKTAPKSFEELEQIAKKQNQPSEKKYGFLYDFKSFFFSFAILNASGGYIFKETEKGLDQNDVGLSHPSFVEGLTFLKKLNQEGILPSSTDRGIAFEHFKNNQLAFMLDGPWGIKDLNESKVHYKIAHIPSFKNKVAKPFVGVQGFMVRRSSQNKLLAKEFIEKFLLPEQGGKTLLKFDQRLPAQLAILNEISNQSEQNQIFKQSIETGIAMPNIPQMGSVWSAMGKAMSLCFDQNYSPEESMKSVAQSIK